MVGDAVTDLLIGLPGLLSAVVFHEYAHAAVADRLGDPTPRRLGRLTLNPVAHVDPVGLLMLLLFRFGWARPVPVNPYYFADRRKGMLYVALAGPATNVVLAFLALLLLEALPALRGTVLGDVLQWVLVYNTVLAVFNILPVPPLDGSRVLAGILPPAQAARVEEMESYGWLVLLALLVTGVIPRLLGPLVRGLMSLLHAAVAGLGL